MNKSEVNDIDFNLVFQYLHKHCVRVFVSVIVCLIQFFWVFSVVRNTNWIYLSLIDKLYLFVKFVVLMAMFEMCRWSDPIIKKFILQKEKCSGSPVDNSYIDRNRRYR